MTKKKVGIVIQRYGLQINGGAEVHARMIAEKLNDKYDITVLTSCAVDHHTWKPELEPGLSYENGIKIIRFKHKERQFPIKNKFDKIKIQYKINKIIKIIYTQLKKPTWYAKVFPIVKIEDLKGYKWLEYQGPTTYGLIKYLKKEEKKYDAFIFFTCLYFPTAIGLTVAPNKSILVPTIHDEDAIYLPIFKQILTLPKCILYNTISEKKFSEKLFNVKNSIQKIVAVGVNEVVEKKENYIYQKFGINQKFILYIGRIDEGKGCSELLQNFSEFLNEENVGLTLVLAGKNNMKPYINSNIIYVGFVSEKDKIQLLLNSEALVIPSQYESLSLVLLESFACKIPVIANEKCEVLRDHILQSGGGWLYNNKDEFLQILKIILESNNTEKGINGFKYVLENYTWKKVIEQYEDAINLVMESNKINEE